MKKTFGVLVLWLGLASFAWGQTTSSGCNPSYQCCAAGCATQTADYTVGMALAYAMYTEYNATFYDLMMLMFFLF